MGRTRQPPPARLTEQCVVMLDKPTDTALRAVADEMGLSVSAVVRECIASGLAPAARRLRRAGVAPELVA